MSVFIGECGGEGVNVAMSASVNIHRGGAQASDAHWVPHTREKGKMESSSVFENPDSVTNQIYLGGADRSRRSRSDAGQAVVAPTWHSLGRQRKVD